MQGLALLVVAIIVITAVVGAIASFLNKLNEANAPAPKARNGDAPRQTQKDMDRFLAEIDRLRKKNQQNAEEPTAQKPKPPQAPKPKKPVLVKSRTEKLKPLRPVAEAVEPPKRKRVDSAPMELPPLPVAPGSLSPGQVNPSALPVASVVGAIPTGATSTGAPVATRVTKLPALPGSKPQSKLDGGLASLLASRQGVAMAVILKEVLGPPKCKKHDSA